MSRAIVILLCAVLSSCQLWRVDEMLNTAERQIDCAADSALITMRAVKRYAVLTPERRARYGLLYSMVLDKNYIDVASDSLIGYSAQYYDRNGTPTERMRAYYYLGRTQENAQKYDKAILSYLDAAQYADNVDDKYLLALLYSHLGSLYYATYNYQNAYECAERAYDYYLCTELKSHQLNQLLDIGQIASTFNKFDVALNRLTEAVSLAKSLNDTTSLMIAYHMQIIAHNKQQSYREGMEVLRQYEQVFGQSHYDNSQICGSVANILAVGGESYRANRLLRMGWELAADSADSIAMYYYSSRLKFIEGKEIDGYKDYTAGLYKQINDLSIAHAHSVSASTMDFVSYKAITDKTQVQHHRKVVVTTIITIIVLSIIAFLFRHFYAKYKERRLIMQIEQNIAIIEDIRRDIDSHSSEISGSLYNAMGKEFAIFNQLCDAFYTYDSEDKKQMNLYRKFGQILDGFKHNDNTLLALEESINNYKGGIMQKLRTEIPSLKEEEYRLLCYIFYGFSNQTISIFMDCTSANISTRKSRLKAKISNSNAPNRTLFLSMF